MKKFASFLLALGTITAPVGASADEPCHHSAEILLPTVIFSELLVDPTGKDADLEFIELRNTGIADATLDGWLMTDGKDREFPLSGLTIAGGGYYVLTYQETKLPLANAGGELSLIGPDGSPVERVVWGQAKEGASYAKTSSGTWEWTSSTTSGSANAFDLPTIDDDAPLVSDVDRGPVSGPSTDDGSGAVAPVGSTPTLVEEDQKNAAADDCPCAATASAGTADAAEPPAQDAGVTPPSDAPGDELSDLQWTESGAAVSVVGIVTLPPGYAGKTIFAIQDEQGQHAALVRSYGSHPMPELSAGDAVALRGTFQERNGEYWITSSGAKIARTGSGTLRWSETSVDGIVPTDAGRAVTVTGIVTDGGKRWFLMSDRRMRTEIRVTSLADGALDMPTDKTEATVSGVVRAKSGKIEILVASKSDLAFAAAPTETGELAGSSPGSEENAVAAARPPIVLAAEPARRATAFIVPAAILALAAGLFIWQRRRYALSLE